MSFLTPFFLLGGLAIAAPIIYHLIRRTTREKQVFSSLMFLLPSPPRISKRHKLQHLWLLLLRCLALLLLALGFARPFLKQTQLNDPTAAQPKRVVIAVDTSASMQRDGAWAAAKARVDTILRGMAPIDQVALLTFSRQATVMLPFDEWNRTASSDRVALATSRLDAVTPGWGGTQLGNALITAAETLGELDTKTIIGDRQVIVVSDLQAGSRLDTLQSYEWPKGVDLLIEGVKARTATNAGVQLVAESTDAPRDAEPSVRVRVTNSADAKREQFKLGWARADAPTTIVSAPIDAYVPPGQSRVFSVPVPKDGPAPDRVVLTGDDDPFDNTVYAIPPAAQRANVLWLGSEAAGDIRQPFFFLRTAFTDTPRLAISVKAQAPAAPLPPQDLADAHLIFVSEELSEPLAAAVRQQLEAGKLVVFVPKNGESGATLGALLGRAPVPIQETKPSRYAMFADIDFKHPLFASFADPRFSDFTKIVIEKYRKLNPADLPGSRVVARFDTGDPIVLEVPAGKGKLMIFTTGWHREDSQLGLSPKFVPLMWSLLEQSGGATFAPTQFFVGDKIALPGDAAATAIRTPQGENLALAAGATEFANAAQPGIYEIVGGTRLQRFALNLDANESRTAPLTADELETLGVPVAQPKTPVVVTPEQRTVLASVEAEGRQKLWRWFVVATLAILLIESALAGWFARRSTLNPS